jgi:transcriptional regulator with XRE-family HTH domain
MAFHVADLLGLSRSSYSRLESGRRPWPEGLRALVEKILTKYEDAARLAAPIAEQARRKVAA